MFIGGGKLCEMELEQDERLVLQSKYDVEEITDYGKKLNPINLFWRGSEFLLGRLFLTDLRLILLPYSQAEVDRAHTIQDISYKLLDKVGFGIPKPEIQFNVEPLVVWIDEIQGVNPFQRQYVVHPTLSVMLSEGGGYRFKFVTGDSPQHWANTIAEWTGCDISDRRIA